MRQFDFSLSNDWAKSIFYCYKLSTYVCRSYRKDTNKKNNMEEGKCEKLLSLQLDLTNQQDWRKTLIVLICPSPKRQACQQGFLQ